MIDPLLIPLRPRIVGICRELGAKRVLDIASGTGAQCRLLGRAGFEAVGLDLSEEMIGLARQRKKPFASYVHASALDLPFDDAAFDVCTLVLALHEHSEAERSRMLAEARRVASDHIVIADYELPPHPSLNLAWRLIQIVEASAGSSHYAGFRDFLTQGALHGFIRRHRLASQIGGHSYFGTISMAAIPAEPTKPVES
jgi:ubiquinone/menaquinone biosynthesis C-methylase UbiE